MENEMENEMENAGTRMHWKDFADLLSERGWTHKKQEEDEHDDMAWGSDDEPKKVLFGWVSVTSTRGDISVTYCEQYNADPYDPDSLEFGPNEAESPWVFEGVTVFDTDDDGEETDLDPEDAMLRVSDECDLGGFTQTDYDFLNLNETEAIDMDNEMNDTAKDDNDDNEYEVFELSCDHAPDVRFRGKLIGSAASSPETASSDYSGTTGRWTVLRLYQTVRGRFVCFRVNRTQWQGDHDKYKVEVCNTETEVIEFFGQGWISKDLYTDAGIENVITVD